MDRVLLVEDNLDDVVLIKRAFKKASISTQLDVVEDGEKAMEYLKHNKPVLILLDLKLPGKSGFDVLEWIKTHNGLRRIPVVVLTSSKNGQDVNKAYDFGANSYIVKPVSFDDLMNIAKHINIYWLMLNERPEV